MTVLTLGSLFDGVAGFPLAFSRAGVATRWVVEIDRDCRRVSARHFPEATAYGDVRECGAHNLAPVDIITFGSPCQDLSVAGRRQGLDGDRSGLFFEAVRIVRELRPAWALWENVPGALSSNGGRDFGAALDALADAGALDLCWRVLDAQWFGLAQRRRRLFLVASFRDGASAAEILFEREGDGRDSAPRRAAGEGAARGTQDGAAFGGNNTAGPIDVAAGLNAKGGSGRMDFDTEKFIATGVAHALTAVGFDASEDGTGRGTPLVPVVSGPLGGRSGEGGFRQDLDNHGAYIPVAHSIAVRGRQDGQEWELGEPEVGNALRAGDGGSSRANWALTPAMAVRRLLPVECCRLQGFPNDWLDNLQLSDSTKYSMLGNAIAIPMVEWIARRLVGANGKEEQCTTD